MNCFAVGSILRARPKDANEWSNGKALMATGSPFPPVDTPGTDKKYIIAECNNVSDHKPGQATSVLRAADDRR